MRWESPTRAMDERWNRQGQPPRKGEGAPLIRRRLSGWKGEFLREPPIDRGGTDVSPEETAPYENRRCVNTIRIRTRGVSNLRDVGRRKPNDRWNPSPNQRANNPRAILKADPPHERETREREGNVTQTGAKPQLEQVREEAWHL